MLKRFPILAVTVLVLSGCGRHVPGPAVAMPGTPYVSWIIMSGDSDDPDREFVCQSQPRTECVIPVSGSADQVFSDVHFYYHGAGAETKYTGSILIGFFKGRAESNIVKTDIAVKKTESITNHSVSGIVTDSPGTYSVDFALVGTVSDTRKTQTIQEKVIVVVK